MTIKRTSLIPPHSISARLPTCYAQHKRQHWANSFQSFRYSLEPPVLIETQLTEMNAAARYHCMGTLELFSDKWIFALMMECNWEVAGVHENRCHPKDEI